MKPYHYDSPESCPPYVLKTGEVIGRGSNFYDEVICRYSRLRPCIIAGALATKYRDDFSKPARLFDSVDWTLMVVACGAPINLLIDPAFQPAEAVQAAIESTEGVERMEEHEVSHGLRLTRVLSHMQTSLELLDPDEEKALWTTLAFAQSAQLSRAIMTSQPWWTARFIRDYGPPAN